MKMITKILIIAIVVLFIDSIDCKNDNVSQIVDDVFKDAKIRYFDMDYDLEVVRSYMQQLADEKVGFKHRNTYWRFLNYDDQFAIKATKFILQSLAGRKLPINNQIRQIIGLPVLSPYKVKF